MKFAQRRLIDNPPTLRVPDSPQKKSNARRQTYAKVMRSLHKRLVKFGSHASTNSESSLARFALVSNLNFLLLISKIEGAFITKPIVDRHHWIPDQGHIFFVSTSRTDKPNDRFMMVGVAHLHPGMDRLGTYSSREIGTSRQAANSHVCPNPAAANT